ncbi:MAG TPA: hypothetical protein ENI23_06140 [bacterium]|nr:hypothetical protein [bacterium]
MAFNPLKLIKNALGSVVGNIPVIGPAVKDLLDSLDNEVAKMSPEQRLVFENAQKNHELEMVKVALQDSSGVRKLAMAELEHPGIKWIRPGILAGLFLMIAFWVALVPLIEGVFGIIVPPPKMEAIPTEMWWVFISGYLGYGTLREVGKAKKLGAK